MDIHIGKEEEFSIDSVRQNVLDKMDTIGNTMIYFEICDKRTENYHIEETCIKYVYTDESNITIDCQANVYNKKLIKLHYKKSDQNQSKIKVDWNGALN